jgi:hypothetical protein
VGNLHLMLIHYVCDHTLLITHYWSHITIASVLQAHLLLSTCTLQLFRLLFTCRWQAHLLSSTCTLQFLKNLFADEATSHVYYWAIARLLSSAHHLTGTATAFCGAMADMSGLQLTTTATAFRFNDIIH